MKQKFKLARNTVTSLALQVTQLISGFILPRLILESYGSEVNGLVNSISQFLHIIAFLELGVGAVVQSAFYKPLAENDHKSLSEIDASAEKFFRRLAGILLVYVLILIVIYPYLAKQDFGHLYTATLIAAISVSMFGQYYFGMVDKLLLTADQRGYIQYTTQIVVLIATTAACAILIKVGASIHFVKLTTSLIYLLRPLFLRWYVNQHYSLNRGILYLGEPIEQKWNGIAQHVAAVVLEGTDTIVLTIFSSLSNVSVYSVYHLVTAGVKQVFMSLSNGIQPMMGELWAKQQIDKLKVTFAWTEWLLHTGTVFLFGCTGVLILPFVQVYTAGIQDANYMQPLFAVLITTAHACHCLRLPYNLMILAAGHYKQTQSNYIVAALLNITISVITVKLWGLIGVAIGTLIAMLYQTLWMALYNSKNLICWPFRNFLKQLIVDALTICIGYMSTCWIRLGNTNYVYWILMAFQVVLLWGIVIVMMNVVFYRDKVVTILSKIYFCVHHFRPHSFKNR